MALLSPRLLKLNRIRRPGHAGGWKLRTAQSAIGTLLAVYVLFAHHAAAARDWIGRPDRMVAVNPHWLLLSSCFGDLTGGQPLHSAPAQLQLQANLGPPQVALKDLQEKSGPVRPRSHGSCSKESVMSSISPCS